ncbi:hypothetical protein [Variovorax sp. GT1P44]|uniref:hypothetical protein n=1 Tax=Variovorax sp. GT1P44 TaxID=3443742 RepID=UPI003F47FBE8
MPVFQVRKKLRRATCNFPSEWEQGTVEARHEWLRDPGNRYGLDDDQNWQCFADHPKSTTFADLPPDYNYTSCDSGGIYWVSKSFSAGVSINRICDQPHLPKNVGPANRLVNGGGNGASTVYAFYSKALSRRSEKDRHDTFDLHPPKKQCPSKPSRREVTHEINFELFDFHFSHARSFCSTDHNSRMRQEPTIICLKISLLGGLDAQNC